MACESQVGLGRADLFANNSVYHLLTAVGNPDGWEGNHQQENFQSLFRVVSMSGRPVKDATCIDIGCGTGEFADFWKRVGGGKYYGIDVYEPSLVTARAKRPNERFEKRDILGGDVTQEKYDFAFLSGALSVIQNSQDNYLFLRRMLQRLTPMVNSAVAFNFLVKEHVEKDDFLFYYDPQKVLDICRDVAPDFRVVTERAKDRNQEDVFLIRSGQTKT